MALFRTITDGIRESVDGPGGIGNLISLVFHLAMYILGPALVCTAIGLIGTVTYNGLTIVLPLKAPPGSMQWCILGAIGVFIPFNIVFNYFSCVSTNPGSHDHPVYKRLLEDARDQGRVTGDHVEGGPGEDRDFLSLGAYEWGYCRTSKTPKAPRSHYDTVSRKLVLNMDHYCPWMFNCVGYRNYRYFVSFLFWVWTGCLYVALCTVEIFMDKQRLRGMGKLRGNVSFTFIMCCALLVSVGGLLFFHLYLVLTCQTTIEFYSNMVRKSRARRRGEVFINAYDMGARKNWQSVFGKMGVLVSLLPSWREAPYPPWPSVEDYEPVISSSHSV